MYHKWCSRVSRRVGFHFEGQEVSIPEHVYRDCSTRIFASCVACTVRSTPCKPSPCVEFTMQPLFVLCRKLKNRRSWSLPPRHYPPTNSLRSSAGRSLGRVQIQEPDIYDIIEADNTAMERVAKAKAREAAAAAASTPTHSSNQSALGRSLSRGILKRGKGNRRAGSDTVHAGFSDVKSVSRCGMVEPDTRDARIEHRRFHPTGPVR